MRTKICKLQYAITLIQFIVILFSAQVYADTLGLRLGSSIPGSDGSIVQFPTEGAGSGGNGKDVQLVYDYEPHRNFYIEGAFGYISPSDIFEYQSMIYEVSPGFKVEWGALVLKLSEGIAYMPENSYNAATQSGYQQVDFATHLTIGLKDPKTGIGIYFDRAHYSNGYSTNNPSLNYAGFMISFPIGKSK